MMSDVEQERSEPSRPLSDEEKTERKVSFFFLTIFFNKYTSLE